MVNHGSTSGSSNDSRFVLLEDRLIGLDGNRDRSVVEGGLQGIWAVFWDVDVGGGTNDTLGLVVLAIKQACFGSVWVGGLGLEFVIFSVNESEVHVSTTASMVDPGAVNEVLLGEGDEVTGLDEMGTFHGSGG